MHTSIYVMFIIKLKCNRKLEATVHNIPLYELLLNHHGVVCFMKQCWKETKGIVTAIPSMAAHYMV